MVRREEPQRACGAERRGPRERDSCRRDQQHIGNGNRSRKGRTTAADRCPRLAEALDESGRAAGTSQRPEAAAGRRRRLERDGSNHAVGEGGAAAYLDISGGALETERRLQGVVEVVGLGGPELIRAEAERHAHANPPDSSPSRNRRSPRRRCVLTVPRGRPVSVAISSSERSPKKRNATTSLYGSSRRASALRVAWARSARSATSSGWLRVPAASDDVESVSSCPIGRAQLTAVRPSACRTASLTAISARPDPD